MGGGLSFDVSGLNYVGDVMPSNVGFNFEQSDNTCMCNQQKNENEKKEPRITVSLHDFLL